VTIGGVFVGSAPVTQKAAIRHDSDPVQSKPSYKSILHINIIFPVMTLSSRSPIFTKSFH
jgi:hypothetical protein